jgi:hypothetical protein
MWKLAALAWMPINAVLFGAFVVAIAMLPDLTRDFESGATAIYGAAALSIILAVPLSWLVARRMLTRRERRRLDAMAGQGLG